ncbi:hypothetical protein XANCAGTX0491_007846 [Xanthoria calcicola]
MLGSYAGGTAYGRTVRAARADGCVQRGVDINSPNSYYGTTTQAAARFGNTTIVQYPLEAGADVNVLHGAYDTAIRAAVRGDHFSAVKMLAGAGADVNLYAHQGQCYEPNARCVLQLAILNGTLGMVEALLSIGANVNAPGNVYGGCFFLDQTSPLHFAVNKGHEQIARALIAHGAMIDHKVGESATPLEIAASRGFVGITQMLIEAGATIKGALRLACCYGHLDVVHLLLGTGAIAADTSQLYDSLNEACHMRRYAILDLLLTEVDLVSLTIPTCAGILWNALKRSDEKALLKILDNSATLPVDALYQACTGYEDFIQETIHKAADRHKKKGQSAAANVEPRDAQYGTPSVAALVQAMVAVRIHWKYEIPDELQKYISELIRLQFDIQTHQEASDVGEIEASVHDNCEKLGGPLILTSFLGHEQTVRLLLDNGADVNTVGGYFRTPLLAALAGHHPRIVDLLIEAGAHRFDGSGLDLFA